MQNRPVFASETATSNEKRSHGGAIKHSATLPKGVKADFILGAMNVPSLIPSMLGSWITETARCSI
jgi:hypothetical protein